MNFQGQRVDALFSRYGSNRTTTPPTGANEMTTIERRNALIARIQQLIEGRRTALQRIVEADTRPRLRLIARDHAFAELAA